MITNINKIYKRSLPASIIAILLIVLSSWLIQNKLKADAKQKIGQSLSTVLDTTHQAIKSWLKEHQTATRIWANTKEVRQLAHELLMIPHTSKSLINSAAQQKLRSWLQPVHTRKGYQGYFIIGLDHINLASSRDQNLGIKSSLVKQKDFMQKIWSGQTAVSLPEKSGVPLPDENGRLREGMPTMFVGAPIHDSSGNVIAIFSFRMNPVEDFTAILQQGRLGITGETYAFDKKGHLISNSRFDAQLRKIGLLSKDEHGLLNIEIRDPGANLVAGKQAKVPRAQQPLTYMTMSAISGNSDMNLEGYDDYRGVSVVGAWLWDDNLNFGITTEIDTSEAYDTLRVTQYVITILTIISVALVIGLTVIFIVNRSNLLRVMAEQKLAEEEARQRQIELAHMSRISTMGEMATDLAHELNQPLTAINTYAAASLRIVSNPDNLQDTLPVALQNISAEAMRAAEIIKRLREFVRKHTPDQKSVILNELINEVIAFIEPEARRHNVTILLELSEKLPDVYADRILVEQVILNLARNAIEAMDAIDVEQRELHIRTMLDDNQVQVSIDDTGPGLTAEEIDKIFEPFFTTKSTGMGMGLSISKSIISAHQGRIWAVPNSMGGTTFKLTLPVCGK